MAVIKKSPGKRQRTLQMKSEKTKPLEGLGALITSNLKKVKKTKRKQIQDCPLQALHEKMLDRESEGGAP